MKRSFKLFQFFFVIITFLSIPLYSEEKTDDDELMQELGKGFGEMSGSFNDSLQQLIKNIYIQNESNKQLMNTIYISLAVIVIVFILIIIFLIVQSVMNLKFQKMQQKQFESTLNLIRETQEFVAQMQLPSGAKTMSALPCANEIDKQEMQSLAEQCEKLGEKIDNHTNRHNNSKNVSEIVFKISNYLGLDKDTSTLYFCAAMVYDSGFLYIPEELFMVDILSSKERMLMKTHVEKFSNSLSFVPKQYLSIFNDACASHHENINGSGYPKGLRAEDIPLVARILRVVESYVSLVSHRTYHKIRDKESAVSELRKQPGIYDSSIVDALESVV
ncbi:MAG: HD domain-containing phosphohydrolase [Treponema sp.]